MGGKGVGVGLEGSRRSIAQVGNKVLNRGCDGGGEGGLPLEEVLGGGGVIVVVEIRGEEVMGGWDGTTAKEEGFGVAGNLAVFEEVKVGLEGGGGFRQEIIGKRLGTNWLAEEADTSGDFW